MSVDKMKEFADKAKKDQSLLEKLKPASTMDEKTSHEHIAKVARESGFDITADDVKAYRDSKLKSGELKQEDLEGVSGGWHVQIGFTALCFGS